MAHYQTSQYNIAAIELIIIANYYIQRCYWWYWWYFLWQWNVGIWNKWTVWRCFGLMWKQKILQLRIIRAKALAAFSKCDPVSTIHQMALPRQGKRILSCLNVKAYGADRNHISVFHLVVSRAYLLIIEGLTNYHDHIWLQLVSNLVW